MRIAEHLLMGEKVRQIHCAKCSRLLEMADTLVLHSTDGANAMSSAQYLARPDTSVSAHIVIGRTGQVIQLLPFNVQAWHAGVSEWDGRPGVNDFSIGIELDNAGRLHRRKGRFYSWFNKEYMPDMVFTTVENGHAAYYHTYTREQLDCLVEVCLLLKARYPIRWLVRHSDISVRKVDPGPAFPFEEVKKRIVLD
ncbi:MAG: N-acetylmuramoyl-L-alanine amidase [Odoribacter sp.]|nr:N-acetylmuramoyl-L-alanine amidase [Odoribacter sp.]